MGFPIVGVTSSTSGSLYAGLNAGWSVSGLINAGSHFNAGLWLNFADKIYISICDAASWIFDAWIGISWLNVGFTLRSRAT